MVRRDRHLIYLCRASTLESRRACCHEQLRASNVSMIILSFLMMHQKRPLFHPGLLLSCNNNSGVCRYISIVVGSRRQGVETAALLPSIRLGWWTSIDSQPHGSQGVRLQPASTAVRKSLNRLYRKTTGGDGLAKPDRCVVLPRFCARLASWPSEKRLVVFSELSGY